MVAVWYSLLRIVDIQKRPMITEKKFGTRGFGCSNKTQIWCKINKNLSDASFGLFKKMKGNLVHCCFHHQVELAEAFMSLSLRPSRSCNQAGR